MNGMGLDAKWTGEVLGHTIRAKLAKPVLAVGVLLHNTGNCPRLINKVYETNGYPDS